MRLSVLICTYNRHELLRGALRSLLVGSSEPPDQVVVVNGGDERADREVERWANHPSTEVRLVKTVNKNLAASRNIGLPHCDGDIIAMTDDDAEVFPDWITLLKRAHGEHPEAGAIGGSVIGTNITSIVGKVADAITFPSWPHARTVRTIPGVNVSYKREVVEKIGLQDEGLFRGEDVDYNWRVQVAGYTVFFDPAIKVYHHHRPTFRALLRQHYMYGRAYFRVRRKWPEMYCVYPHRLHQPKDLAKAVNFFAALLYQPLLNGQRIATVPDRIKAIPALIGLEVAWRVGMVDQGLKDLRQRS